MLEIILKKSKTIAIVELTGTIDIDSANLIEKIGWCLDNGYKDILCNFENINLIDYAGLSVIAIAYKNVLNHKGRLKLANVPMHIKKIFSLVCLDRLFEIYDTTNHALKSFEDDTALREIQRKKLRRRFRRLPLDIDISYKPVSGTEPFAKGKVLNISGVGLLIFCEKTYPLSEVLDFKLSLMPAPGHIEGKAKVAWLVRKDLQPQIYPGMGLAFHDMDSQLQEQIVSYVERNLPSGSECT